MNISVEKLLSLKNPNIIDVRSLEKYNNNHIPGAKNISYNSLLIAPDKFLNKEEDYYIYCKRGMSSNGLCQILRKQGYKVYSVIGGYEAWLLNK